MTLFESLMISKSVEICRSLYLIDLYHFGVDCFDAFYVLKVICLCSHSTDAPSTFDSRSCLLDSDEPITFGSISGVSV
jgi:hypothetical protein